MDFFGGGGRVGGEHYFADHIQFHNQRNDGDNASEGYSQISSGGLIVNCSLERVA